ncbi:unnamed protein product [Cylicocyclus nassatus]|uniref:Uncharacterized protein n=1 Tax=Cylicocyclus nassatus TaxID=53992 RepID=A0AA36H7U0_CYLNA|nr:unnamed protein product [Cylicocyclus nassatus]
MPIVSDCTKALKKFASSKHGLFYCLLITVSCTSSYKKCDTGHFYPSWQDEFAKQFKQHLGRDLSYHCYLQTGARYYVKLKDGLKTIWIGETKFVALLNTFVSGTKVADLLIEHWKKFNLSEAVEKSSAFGCSYDYYIFTPWPTYMFCSFDTMRPLTDFFDFVTEHGIIRIGK